MYISLTLICHLLQVVLFDVEPAQVDRALKGIDAELKQFEKEGLLKGQISAQEQSDLITGCSDLEECVKVSSRN